MSDTEWLASLKEGDEVVLRHGLGGRDHLLRKVARVTPTQIVVGNTRFRKQDGREVGGSGYYAQSILRPDPDLRARVEQRAYTTQLRDWNWGAVGLDKLRRIIAILGEPEKVA